MIYRPYSTDIVLILKIKYVNHIVDKHEVVKETFFFFFIFDTIIISDM